MAKIVRIIIEFLRYFVHSYITCLFLACVTMFLCLSVHFTVLATRNGE